jgi:hypothetical protein
VNDVETLSSALSNSVWQKITLLERVARHAPPGSPAAPLVPGAERPA